jgi:hypothetical protein
MCSGLVKNKKTVEDHILNEIQKTGYPLEIEISDLLEKDWFVINGQPFLDLDTNEIREIDLMAAPWVEADDELRKGKEPIGVSIELAIECKKSNTHAWVFFTKPKKIPPGFGTAQVFDWNKALSQDKDVMSYKYVTCPVHYDNFDRVAHAYKEIKLENDRPSGKDEIFEGLNQVTKYVEFSMRQLHTAYKIQWGPIFMFSIPAIVFEGLLFEAIVKNGKCSLYRRDEILVRKYRPSKIPGQGYRYLVDVVTKQFFPKYLEALNKDVRNIRKYMRNHLQIQSF